MRGSEQSNCGGLSRMGSEEGRKRCMMPMIMQTQEDILTKQLTSNK